MNISLRFVVICIFASILACCTQKENDLQLTLESLPKHWVTLKNSEYEKETNTVDCEGNGVELIVIDSTSAPRILLVHYKDTTVLDVLSISDKDSLSTKFQTATASDTSIVEFKWIDKSEKRASWSIGYFYAEYTSKEGMSAYPCYKKMTYDERLFRNMSTHWTLLTQMDNGDVIYQPCQSELQRLEIENKNDRMTIVVYTGNDSDKLDILTIHEANKEIVTDDLILTTSVPFFLTDQIEDANMTTVITFLNEREIVLTFSSLSKTNENVTFKYVDSDYTKHYRIVNEEDCDTY